MAQSGKAMVVQPDAVTWVKAAIVLGKRSNKPYEKVDGSMHEASKGVFISARISDGNGTTRSIVEWLETLFPALMPKPYNRTYDRKNRSTGLQETRTITVRPGQGYLEQLAAAGHIGSRFTKLGMMIFLPEDASKSLGAVASFTLADVTALVNAAKAKAGVA